MFQLTAAAKFTNAIAKARTVKPGDCINRFGSYSAAAATEFSSAAVFLRTNFHACTSQRLSRLHPAPKNRYPGNPGIRSRLSPLRLVQA